MRTRFYRAKRACLRTIWDEPSAFAVTSTRTIETPIPHISHLIRARGGANPSCPCCLVRLPDPALRIYWSSSRCHALQHNLHECNGVQRVAECDRQAASGSRATTASRRGPRDGVSGCTDGLFSAHAGDRGWLRPLPLRGEPLGAALTLRTQHSPGFAAYQPCLR